MNPTLAGLLTTAIWSCASLLVTVAGRIPPFQVLAISWIVASFMLFLFYRRKGKNSEQKAKPFDYPFVTFGVAGSTACYYLAFQHAPPFEVNTLNYLWPLLLIACICASERRNPTTLQILGMLLGFAGCVALGIGRAGGFSFGGLGIGHLFALMSASIWAIYSTFARSKNYPPSFMTRIFFITATIYLCCHLTFETWVWPNAVEWLVIGVLAVSDISYALWDYGIRYGDRILITSVAYFIPFFSTLLLILAGYSAANAMIFLAGALIITGCIVVNITQFKKLVKRS